MLCTTNYCYTQNITALKRPHGFREEDFFMFSYCRSTGDDDPRGMANLDPRSMISRIYVEYHLTLLHTNYTSFRPCGFREEDF